MSFARMLPVTPALVIIWTAADSLMLSRRQPGSSPAHSTTLSSKYFVQSCLHNLFCIILLLSIVKQTNMSLINSVLGSLSPKFRSSFEDPHAREHELPQYRSPSSSPRIPPPISSTVLWNARSERISSQPRVPDDLLAIQRRARHLEQQLQELLDAQADGLLTGLGGNESAPDDLVSNGSTTPTVSSVRDHERSAENWDNRQTNNGGRKKKRKISLNVARRGISRRIQQLSSVKDEELDILDGNLHDLQVIVERTEAWAKKKTRLQRRIRDIETESNGDRGQMLRSEASKLEQEIRRKEEELRVLKSRHRRVLDEIAEGENSLEARMSSYKSSLSMLDKDVATFLARPPVPNHAPLSKLPFLSLPPNRRTLELAHEYWQDEHNRLLEKCQEVDTDRAALDEGVVLWDGVVNKVTEFESSLQDYMQFAAGRKNDSDPSDLLSRMGTTTAWLEKELESASSKGWNLLVCAIGAELEAFKQGRTLLEAALGVQSNGKEKASKPLVDAEDSHTDSEGEGSSSAIRLTRSPPKSTITPKPKFFDTDDEDPDPELMISHQDTDTD
ncbi:hypothetical protein BU24DRAFT_417607 [Aaosphaeria arxii CBS 175.79]|uniref:Autophagy-related protein 28 n=1 Tax=Aaosphaeria arxii CBS 175.79 TaxID=1450172 RepID=A0A6A5YB07_9PLEO|nr:uncharacterized protein BU24DRAFT_417607 [Aaosphaeria arxii CBS 175.79]KAF2021960.1 hypothetical protein BU24DRAFT_417607 [Aaosphaeria arxii CBS 175.79]